jgi:hypothetical protein
MGLYARFLSRFKKGLQSFMQERSDHGGKLYSVALRKSREGKRQDLTLHSRENILAPITARGDMIERVEKFNAERAGHGTWGDYTPSDATMLDLPLRCVSVLGCHDAGPGSAAGHVQWVRRPGRGASGAEFPA